MISFKQVEERILPIRFIVVIQLVQEILNSNRILTSHCNCGPINISVNPTIGLINLNLNLPRFSHPHTGIGYIQRLQMTVRTEEAVLPEITLGR